MLKFFGESYSRGGRPLSQATLLHPASWGLLRRPLGAHRASRRGPPSVRPVLGFALTCAVQAGLGPPSKVEGLVSHCLHVRRAGAHTCAVWNSVARTDAMASERPGVRGHPTVFTVGGRIPRLPKAGPQSQHGIYFFFGRHQRRQESSVRRERRIDRLTTVLVASLVSLI